jgi:hypothetical protein
MSIFISLSGLLFLLILVLNFAMTALGNKIEVGEYDVDAKLRQISESPAKFRWSVVLGLIEHLCIIALAILLFIAFSSYNLILGIVWTAFRIVEGSIFIFNTIKYLGLLDVANRYSVATNDDKAALGELARTALQTRNARYTLALLFWSIGTLAYSILFVAHGLVPPIIGWLGIVTGITFGIGNAIQLVTRRFNILLLAGLLALCFELLIGGWLLFSPLFR